MSCLLLETSASPEWEGGRFFTVAGKEGKDHFGVPEMSGRHAQRTGFPDPKLCIPETVRTPGGRLLDRDSSRLERLGLGQFDAQHALV